MPNDHEGRRGRVLLIIPYFGAFGPWFPLFLHTISKQRTIDLLLVTDQELAPPPPNVRRLKMNLCQMRERASRRLNLSLALDHPRKLCDLKPAYGLIFAEHLSGYDYWAYGDEDLFFGDVDGMLAPRLEAEPDVLSPTQNATVGHLTVVKNRPDLLDLVTTDPEYREALRDKNLWAWDEWSWGGPEGCGSFSRTVCEGAARGELKVDWGLLKSGNRPRPWRSHMYETGSIIGNDDRELLYFHWGTLKQSGYRFPTVGEAEAGFGFDRYGVYPLNIAPIHQSARRVVGRTVELARKGMRGARRAASSLGARSALPRIGAL